MDTTTLLFDLKPIVHIFLLGLFVWTTTGCLILGSLLVGALYETIKTLFRVVYSICDFMRFVLTVNLLFTLMVYYEIHSIMWPMKAKLVVIPETTVSSQQIGEQYRIIKENYFLHPSQYIRVDRDVANPVDKCLYEDNIRLIRDVGYEIEEKENLYYLRFSHDIPI